MKHVMQTNDLIDKLKIQEVDDNEEFEIEGMPNKGGQVNEVTL